MGKGFLEGRLRWAKREEVLMGPTLRKGHLPEAPLHVHVSLSLSPQWHVALHVTAYEPSTGH